jgi:predicted MFS family arabinose efflux permease
VAIPAGMLVYGLAVQRFGLTATLVASAVTYLVAWILMAVSRNLHGLEPLPRAR